MRTRKVSNKDSRVNIRDGEFRTIDYIFGDQTLYVMLQMVKNVEARASKENAFRYHQEDIICLKLITLVSRKSTSALPCNIFGRKCSEKL